MNFQSSCTELENIYPIKSDSRLQIVKKSIRMFETFHLENYTSNHMVTENPFSLKFVKQYENAQKKSCYENQNV